MQKFTAQDFPGRIATIIFTAGCNLKCHYCHNKKIAFDEKLIDHLDVYEHLQKRRDLLEGVVLSGGEPTIHDDIVSSIHRIRKLGYDIKLDTNGTKPKILDRLIRKKMVDYVAMDIKTSPEKYKYMFRGNVEFDKIIKSINITKKAPEYEFRTTIVPSVVSLEDMKNIANLCNGAEKFYIQKSDYSQNVEEYKDIIKDSVESCVIR